MNLRHIRIQILIVFFLNTRNVAPVLLRACFSVSAAGAVRRLSATRPLSLFCPCAIYRKSGALLYVIHH